MWSLAGRPDAYHRLNRPILAQGGMRHGRGQSVLSFMDFNIDCSGVTCLSSLRGSRLQGHRYGALDTRPARDQQNTDEYLRTPAPQLPTDRGAHPSRQPAGATRLLPAKAGGSARSSGSSDRQPCLAPGTRAGWVTVEHQPRASGSSRNNYPAATQTYRQSHSSTCKCRPHQLTAAR